MRARGEGGNREKGANGWITLPTQWTLVWTSSGRQWRTGDPGMLQFMGSQIVGYDSMTEQQKQIFSCVCWPFVYLLWRYVYSNVFNILKLVSLLLFLSCSSLKIPYIILLHDTHFANIFHSVGGLFTLLIKVLQCTEVFSSEKFQDTFLFPLHMLLVLYPRMNR